MDTRTVGIEEELLLVDPTTRWVTSRAREVIKDNLEHGPGVDPSGASDELDHELFGHQIEIRTEPSLDLAELERQIARGRSTASAAAERHGLAVAACATIPLGDEDPVVSPSDRYRDMVARFGDVALSGTSCGMHIHVAIESPEEGVGCLDRIAPWLPVLLAVSGNSPYHRGRDTGYASWRSQLWSRWPSAGPTEAFGSVSGYRRTCERLIASGAARDTGMLYFDARLAAEHPTLEVRVLDAVTDIADIGLLAALVRALVETTAGEWAEGRPPADWRCEDLRAASWRASRMGMSGDLVHPLHQELCGAREVLGSLVELVGPRLDANGDADRVATGMARVLSAAGAARQRAAFERSGSIEAVVDDVVARTTDSWASLVDAEQH